MGTILYGDTICKSPSTSSSGEGNHNLLHRWNAARSFASYLDTNTPLYASLNVLELGAGGALPSLVAAKNNAGLVVITDYPDDSLVDNIQWNISGNLSPAERDRTFARGYIWGRSTDELMSLAKEKTGRASYDLIILSDLVFNHSQHDALLATCESALTPSTSESSGVTPSVLVFYTHHRPHLAHRDMEFFSKAEAKGWVVEKVVEERFPVRLCPRFTEPRSSSIILFLYSPCSLTTQETKKSVRPCTGGSSLDPHYNHLSTQKFQTSPGDTIATRPTVEIAHTTTATAGSNKSHIKM